MKLSLGLSILVLVTCFASAARADSEVKNFQSGFQNELPMNSIETFNRGKVFLGCVSQSSAYIECRHLALPRGYKQFATENGCERGQKACFAWD